MVRMLFLAICCSVFMGYGQNFVLEGGGKYAEFNFKTVSNLVILPVTINGVPLNFVLDTGVAKTVILNLSDNDSLQVNNATDIYLTGLGKKEPFKAIYSNRNHIQIGSIVDKNHEVYIVLDDAINFSKRLGVEIHGIIGYNLLKDFVVQIDYGRGKIRFYPHNKFKRRKKRSEEQLPIELFKYKPYVTAKIKTDTLHTLKLLLDTGSTDAVWLLKSDSLYVSGKSFEDQLGRGLNGDIYGKRTKVDVLQLNSFELEEVKCAFPDEEYLVHFKNDNNRNGSIGGEIFSRFIITFNYKQAWVRLRKGRYYHRKFYYNMSGIELEHNGVRVVEEEVRPNNAVAYDGASQNGVTLFYQSQLNYTLASSIEIMEVREGSPAYLAGVQKGDVVLRINNYRLFNQSIEEIANMLNTKEGKKIKLEVLRNGKKLKLAFVLQKVL